MVSVQREKELTKVSLHRMFIYAPTNIMDALACYIVGRQKMISPDVRRFIDIELRRLNYQVNPKRLDVYGEAYHLQQIFDALQQEYFGRPLPLYVTWYGDANKKYRSGINLGLYSDPLKLIKIHRVLDSIDVPESVVRFVLYHEMLHYLHPPIVTDSGRSILHTPDFKKSEKQFREYRKATNWINKQKHHFFI